MTKTKIKVVGGEVNTKRLKDLRAGDVFIMDEKSIIRTFIRTDRVDQHDYIYCVDIYNGETREILPNYTPDTVYRKMKVKLYE